MNDKLNIAKKECCHFFEDYNGERNICLLIEKPCVLSQGLNCTYFNTSVRPEYTGELKKCERCNKEFRPKSNRQKYCSDCSKKAKREQKRKHMQKKRVLVEH